MKIKVKYMPILGIKGNYIPYDLVKQHEKQVMKNHCGQTLNRICERGGLDWNELCCVLIDIPFINIPTEVAKNIVDLKVYEFGLKMLHGNHDEIGSAIVEGFAAGLKASNRR